MVCRSAAPWTGGISLAVLLLATSITAFQPEGGDPYKILGLKRGGELDAGELKRTYRKLALQWHPDKVSQDKRKEAEQKFIEIAWAYEVLSDPGKRDQYATEPGPGAGFPGGAADGGKRDFSMNAAAKVFKDAFGTTSDDYQDLIKHLMSASGKGSKAQWRKHAEEIQAQLKANGKEANFEVETEDGNGRIKTSQKVTSDGKGGSVKTTVTEHVHTSVNGAPEALGHGAAGNPALSAHMAAHEAAVKAAQEAHRKAVGGPAASKLLGEL